MVAEASVLESLASTDVPVPRAVAVSNGAETGGEPAILMTRMPGLPQFEPSEPDSWAAEMASMLVRVHTARIAAPEWNPGWIDPVRLSPPSHPSLN